MPIHIQYIYDRIVENINMHFVVYFTFFNHLFPLLALLEAARAWGNSNIERPPFAVAKAGTDPKLVLVCVEPAP